MAHQPDRDAKRPVNKIVVIYKLTLADFFDGILVSRQPKARWRWSSSSAIEASANMSREASTIAYLKWLAIMARIKC
jgi:hypothetical protein